MPLSIALVTLNAKFIHSSLSLRYLRNAARGAGFDDVWLGEFTVHQPTWKIAAEIQKHRPHVLGVSIYIWNRAQSFELIEMLKKQNPDLKVVIGGPEVSFEPELSPEYITIAGEGEAKWIECLDHIKRNATPTPETLARWNTYGTDLPELQVPYLDEDLPQLQNRYAYLETSRGCPYKCSFCLSALDKSVRYFDDDAIHRQIKSLLHAGVEKVKFVDRTFNLNPQRMKSLMQWLAHHPDAEYHFEVVGDLLSDDMLGFLGTVPRGLFQFEIGIQTTNDDVQTVIERKQDKEKLFKAIATLVEQDRIHLHTDLIFGLPGEDKARALASFTEIFNLRPHEVQMGFLKFLPGAPIRNQIEPYQYRFLSTPPYEIIANRDLSPDDVLYLKKFAEAFDLFYNSKRFRFSIDHQLKTHAPVELFDRLMNHLEDRNLLFNALSLDNQYKAFADTFALENDPLALDLLKLDYLYHQRTYRIPGFLQTPWPGNGKPKTRTWPVDRKTPVIPFQHEIRLENTRVQLVPAPHTLLYAVVHPEFSPGYLPQPRIERVDG
jgi:anaerobic magnesium-protoporphyrin IX monomethyl ester cyclase